jgi:glycerophosphoryl diester phosphodiesterase
LQPGGCREPAAEGKAQSEEGSGRSARSRARSHPYEGRSVNTARLAHACDAAGLELVAWTVEELPRMLALLALGVDGICSNDPRLFDEL